MAACKLSFGRKRRKTLNKKSKRKSRRTRKRTRRRTKRKSKFGLPPRPNFYGRRRRRSTKSKRRRRRSTKRSRRARRRSRFGKMPNLQRIMGNYRPPAEMNTYQEYLGMGTEQRARHMEGIAPGNRASFYA